MVGVGVPHTDTHGGCGGISHRHPWWVQGYLTQTPMVGVRYPHGGCRGASHRHSWWVQGCLTQTLMVGAGTSHRRRPWWVRGGISHRHPWWVRGYLTQTSMVGAGVPHTDTHGGCRYLTQTSMVGAGVSHTDTHGGCGGTSHRHPCYLAVQAMYSVELCDIRTRLW